MGGIIEKKIDKIRIPNIVLVLTSCVIMHFIKWILLSRIDGITWDNVYRAYTTIPTVIMASVIFILCVRIEMLFMECKKLLYIVGSNTMTIYYLHWIF